ncbi:MAG: TRAP transporter large permease subunit, partial [Deltaproteobacteria bacterium]|nr:TRAP transporter large permease subunit [Deltaproteobacteria bacterium]
MTLVICSALLLVLAFLGTPLFAIIVAAAMLGFYFADIDLIVVIIELYRIVDTPLLLALPLFTFAGYLLAESNTSHRLVRATQALIGWLPGGLAVVAYCTCAFFTAFTGASGITIVAIGALLLPALTEAGYQEKFSLGLVTTSGSLGLLLAPSLPLILYGIIVQQMNLEQTVEIKDLFIAGIAPALLMIVLLSTWTLWHNRKHPIPLQAFSKDEAI